MKHLYLILFVGISLISVADDLDSTQNSIIFFKDPRIDVLEKIYTYKKKELEKTIKVHVFQATNRDEVFKAKTDFTKRFPGIPTFIIYQSPNFKLRAGEFDSKTEAQSFLKQVKPIYPASFVIEETVANKPK